MDGFCKSDAKVLFFLGICKGLREKYVFYTLQQTEQAIDANYN